MGNKDLLAERSFTKKDQIIFAKLSGDYNPIHISDDEAQKSQTGECIVHGVNIFLWALEKFLEKKDFINSKFEVKFLKPVTLNKKISCFYDSEKLKIFISDGFEKYVLISLNEKHYKSYPDDKHGLKNKKLNLIPKETNLEELSSIKKISLMFNGCESYVEELFPLLSKKIGIGIISQIASNSEIVGMQLPGKYSIFTKLSINFRNIIDTKYKAKLISYNNRLGIVKINCIYKNIDTFITAYFRPKPFKPLECKNINVKLKSNEFKNIKALIIGGSRGIGSCLAKLIAIGGGESIITYRSHKKDALEIKSDISSWGSKCNVIKFDINDDDFTKINQQNVNQIYYLPTPKIVENKENKFNYDLYKKYLNYYVSSYEKLVENCLSNLKSIFYPSTIYIDEDRKFYSEYIKAKIKGEKICKHLRSSSNLIVIAPRLPKLLTDQTNTILYHNDLNTYEILLPFIREMNKISY